MEKTIFDKGVAGRSAESIKNFLPSSLQSLLRQHPLDLPQVTELELTRHYSLLAQENVGIDTIPYPLGSCTMKFNPRVLEKAAALPDFQTIHPLAPAHLAQGNLELLHTFTLFLSELLGMDGGTFSPYAGAQGEFVGLHLIKMFHASHGEIRDEILIPNAAHGTNPASASLLGYKIITLSTTSEGDVNLEEIKKVLSPRTAGLMLTNPNTLGLFSPSILEISCLIHAAGGLLYYDGANLNPLMGLVKVGEMGFDVLHLNLHKSFATPHGGGGPGAGPVFCKKALIPFLPPPQIEKINDTYHWKNKQNQPRPSPFQGNFGIILRAYLYTLLLGKAGLQRSALAATLNANYLKGALSTLFEAPYKAHCLHEFILSMNRFKKENITALDLAKRLIDLGIHPPTMYFPRIVEEAFLIEPTESETKATLDSIISAFQTLASEGETHPEKIKNAPHTTKIQRPDEVKAVKDLKVTA
jgi:glycine dehydrogenase subunit 2